MAGQRELRDMSTETNWDVKWICRTLKWMEERDAEVEGRLRSLKN
jgi:uncharacterized protein YjaG (DUF416 family)